MERGKYIVFEGLPKCGKSTQAKMLYEELTKRLPNERILLTREPGGSELADEIRYLVQGIRFSALMTLECEAYLYAASRAQTLRTVVWPVVAARGIVLSDRSVKSSEAFQGGARGLGIATVREINRVAVGDVKPDKVYFIDTDVKTCHQRSRVGFDGSDKFEAMELDFFKKIRDGYLSFSSEMEIVSGDHEIEAIHGLILASVLKLLHEFFDYAQDKTSTK